MASQYTWLIPLYPSVLRGLFDLCSHYSKNYDNVKQGKIKKQQYKNRTCPACLLLPLNNV
jgi:hypothetical protein